MLTFNWVLEKQPIASGILTQPSLDQRAEYNLIADETLDAGGYLDYIYFFIVVDTVKTFFRPYSTQKGLVILKKHF